MEIFGIPLAAFLGQLLLGLVNGSFYAMLSPGLAVVLLLYTSDASADLTTALLMHHSR